MPGRVLNTIYFGGGTPSLMAPDTVSAIIEAARAAWPTANDVEITLEANPNSVEAARFAAYRQAGVNRVSLGVQALNDDDLKALGRLHSAAEARRALQIAQSSFDRVSFDLIHARQNQNLADWRKELKDALSMASGHLSLYQLTIEDGTAFGDRLHAGKLPGLPTEDLSGDMYFETQELCEQAGLMAYEVSNHAKPGLESRHNLIYWRYGDYAGIGPGAHGRITIAGKKHATETRLSPLAWLKSVEDLGTGETICAPVSGIDQAAEYLMFGLRISEGVNLDRVANLAGRSLDDEKIVELAGYGLIQRDAQRLKATQKGRAVLNAIIRDLLPGG